MMLQSKNLAELAEADFHALRDNRVSEGAVIDYKRELPGSSDSDKKEFLYDVSSFANACGGDLIYGIEEEAGVPTKVTGVIVSNPDAELRRLQSLVLDGVEPRMPGVELRFIPCQNSAHLLVLRIPRSWMRPHMVTFQGVDRFYTRNSGGKHRLDLNELRSLFALSGEIAERVKKFRVERLGQIIADGTPVPLDPEPKIVLHIVPFQAFASGTRIDLKVASALPDGLLTPLGAPGYSIRPNLDGLLYFSRVFREAKSSGYLQLFHNGMIETVNACTLSANSRSELPQFRVVKLIPSTSFEEYLITQIPKYLIGLEKLGMQPPVALMLTLIGVKDYWMALNAGLGGGTKIDRDILVVPEVVLEKIDCKPIDVKPLLDAVWNAAGSFESPNFDSSGHWIKRR